MNRTLSLKYLWWKELRQLVPLIAMLLAIGGCLHLFSALIYDRQEANYDAWRHVMVGLALPALFAVGVGAIIVGQEREQRTIDWLRSLPITVRDILITKLLSGLIGLLVIWGISMAVAGAMLLLRNKTYFAVEIEILPLFVHSLFLLAVGFTTAWLTRSAFVSLLSVVPLALLPMAATLIQDFFTERSLYRADQGHMFVIYSLLFAALFSVWAWRQGSIVLGAHTVKPSSLVSNAASSVGWAKVRPGATYVVASKLPALLWQFARQNMWAIVGLGILFYISIISLAYVSAEPSGILPLIGCLLSTSWLGQLAFQADSVDRRHLFLASRGVPGWQVWLTRQLIPLAILASGASLTFLLGGFFPLTMLLLPLFTVYASSQFLCQLLRSPILGAIASPIFAFLCAIYLYFTGNNVLWLAGLSSLILFVATLILVRSWMDGRSGWRVPAKYLAFLAIAALLPTLPAIYGFGGLERLSSPEKQRLEQLARQAMRELRNSGELPLPIELTNNLGLGSNEELGGDGEDFGYLGLQGEEAMAFAEGGSEGPTPTDDDSTVAYSDSDAPPRPTDTSAQREAAGQAYPFRVIARYPLDEYLLLQASLEQLQTSDGMPNNYVLNSLVPKMLLRRMRAEQSTTQENLEKYRLAVQLAFESARRLRQSIFVEVQNQADRVEIALLEECRQSKAEELIGSQFYADIRQQLKNQSARDRVRRLAIAAKWYRERNRGFVSANSFAEACYAWLSQPYSDVMYQKLVELTEAPSKRQEFRNFQNSLDNSVPGLASQSSPANLYLKDANGVPQLLYSELDEYGPHAVDWYGEWEQLAAEL